MQPKGKSEANEDPHPWNFSKENFRGSCQQYAGETKAMWKICLIKPKAAVYKEEIQHRYDGYHPFHSPKCILLCEDRSATHDPQTAWEDDSLSKCGRDTYYSTT